MNRFICCTSILTFLFANSIEARNLYVNNLTGHDKNNGRSEQLTSFDNGPTRTIGRALRLAEYADTIVIANTGEPYRECVSVFGSRNSGSSRNPFVIEGNGAMVDGSEPIESYDWQPVGGHILKFRPPRISHQQIYLDGRPAEQAPIGRHADLRQLQPRQFCRLGTDLFFRVDEGKLPEDYDLAFSRHQAGITLYQVRHVVIRDLVVQGFQLDGVNAADSAFQCRLVGLATRANGRSGISVGGASTVRIESCISGDNGVAQLRTEGWSKADVVRSELLGQTAPAWKMEGGQLSLDGQTMRRDHAPAERIPLHRPH